MCLSVDKSFRLAKLLVQKHSVDKYEMYANLFHLILKSDIPEEVSFDVLGGLINSTVYNEKTPPGEGYKLSLTYLTAASLIDVISVKNETFPKELDVTILVERIARKVFKQQEKIFKDGITNSTTLPNNKWLSTVIELSKINLSSQETLWWDIIDRPELFEGIDKDTLGIYFSELQKEEYNKLRWNDSDSDIGRYDNPDITVVEQTIQFIRGVLDDIPKDRRPVAFN